MCAPAADEASIAAEGGPVFAAERERLQTLEGGSRHARVCVGGRVEGVEVVGILVGLGALCAGEKVHGGAADP